jgi:uncharacterized protein YndB with AHSA1/START domain
MVRAGGLIRRKNMTERSVVHSTFAIERSYPASPERLFAAFSDPAKKRRWFAEGEEFQIEHFEVDFRVGGIETARFRSKDGRQTFQNDTVYRDILENRRIVIAYNMSAGQTRISASLATFEFIPNGKDTDLEFTEQAAFFEGADGPEIRKEGWRLLLGQLEKELAR